MASRKTPQTTEEFVDYRISETETRIEELQKKQTSGFEKINEKLDKTFATKDYVDGGDKKLHERIASLEDDRKWFIRAILGIIIAAVTSLILVTK